MAHTQITTGRIKKLDGLRGIFSCMVLLFHYPKEYIPEWLHGFFFIRESYTFVDFFFVLSGFVIAYNYHTISNTSDLKKYLIKRWIRLYPLILYSATFVLLYMLAYTHVKTLLVQGHPGLFSTEDIVFPKDTYRSFLDTLFLTNSTPILGNSMGLPGPSWSISAECISYVLYGFLFLFLRGRTRVITSVSIILLSLVLLYLHGEYFSTGEYGFLRGITTFSCGFLIWEASHIHLRLPNVFEYLIPVLITLCFFILHTFESATTTFLVFGMFSIPLLFSAVIFTLLKSNGAISAFLDTRPIQYLGKISYSIYLDHWYVIAFGTPILISLFHAGTDPVKQLIIFLFIIALCLVYAHFTYTYIEMKLGKWLKKKLLQTHA